MSQEQIEKQEEVPVKIESLAEPDTCVVEDIPNDLLEELYSLRKMLKVLLRKEFLTELINLAQLIDNSYIQRYNEICEQSRLGRNCGYASKAKDLYLKLQALPIEDKLKEIYEVFLKDKK